MSVLSIDSEELLSVQVMYTSLIAFFEQVTLAARIERAYLLPNDQELQIVLVDPRRDGIVEMTDTIVGRLGG